MQNDSLFSTVTHISKPSDVISFQSARIGVKGNYNRSALQDIVRERLKEAFNAAVTDKTPHVFDTWQRIRGQIPKTASWVIKDTEREVVQPAHIRELVYLKGQNEGTQLFAKQWERDLDDVTTMHRKDIVSGLTDQLTHLFLSYPEQVAILVFKESGINVAFVRSMHIVKAAKHAALTAATKELIDNPGQKTMRGLLRHFGIEPGSKKSITYLKEYAGPMYQQAYRDFSGGDHSEATYLRFCEHHRLEQKDFRARLILRNVVEPERLRAWIKAGDTESIRNFRQTTAEDTWSDRSFQNLVIPYVGEVASKLVASRSVDELSELQKRFELTDEEWEGIRTEHIGKALPKAVGRLVDVHGLLEGVEHSGRIFGKFEQDLPRDHNRFLFIGRKHVIDAIQNRSRIKKISSLFDKFKLFDNTPEAIKEYQYLCEHVVREEVKKLLDEGLKALNPATQDLVNVPESTDSDFDDAEASIMTAAGTVLQLLKPHVKPEALSNDEELKVLAGKCSVIHRVRDNTLADYMLHLAFGTKLRPNADRRYIEMLSRSLPL